MYVVFASQEPVVGLQFQFSEYVYDFVHTDVYIEGTGGKLAQWVPLARDTYDAVVELELGAEVLRSHCCTKLHVLL